MKGLEHLGSFFDVYEDSVALVDYFSYYNTSIACVSCIIIFKKHVEKNIVIWKSER